MTDEPSLMKEFTGFVWVGNQPGIRLEILAPSFEEAKALVTTTYGEGCFISLTDVQAANRVRCVPTVLKADNPVVITGKNARYRSGGGENRQSDGIPRPGTQEVTT